jgi:hypothetical protein
VILGAHARPGELQDVAVGELRRAVERPRRASMMHNLVVASENDEIVKMHNLVVASENDEIVNQKIIEEGVMTLAKMQAVSQGSRINLLLCSCRNKKSPVLLSSPYSSPKCAANLHAAAAMIPNHISYLALSFLTAFAKSINCKISPLPHARALHG